MAVPSPIVFILGVRSWPIREAWEADLSVRYRENRPSPCENRLPSSTHSGPPDFKIQQRLSADSVEKLDKQKLDFLTPDKIESRFAWVTHVFRGFCSGLVVFDRIQHKTGAPIR